MYLSINNMEGLNCTANGVDKPLSQIPSFTDMDLDYIVGLPATHFRLKSSLPETPGIYFVVVATPKTSLVYIGESGDLCKRWRNHHISHYLEFCCSIGVDIFIHTLSLDWLEVDRKLLEHVLIKRLQPVGNELLTNPQRVPVINPATDREKMLISQSINGPLESKSKQFLLGIATRLGLAIPEKYPSSALIEAIKTELGDLYVAHRRNPKKASQRSKEMIDIEFDRRREELIVMARESIIQLTGIQDPQRGIDVMTIRELKSIASTIGVLRYSYMNTEELRHAIRLVIAPSSAQVAQASLA